MKNKLLIINKIQFGYHTDYYKYCEYLKDKFDITFLCFDSGLKKMNVADVKVGFVSTKGNRLVRGIRFFFFGARFIFKFNGVIFIHFFEGCQYLKFLFPLKRMILDIRTLSIIENIERRKKENSLIKNACKAFDFITFISEGVRDKLNINKINTSILPLGSDMISETKKDFKRLKLLYIGTLNNRNIIQTIEGIKLFVQKYGEKQITYDIVGVGGEFNQIKDRLNILGLQNVVKMHGRVPNNEIKPFLDKCNIGVSYVPMTDYYDYQPVTKTFEYILSGLVCIASRTHENKLAVNDENGVLCDDNPQSFADSIEIIARNPHKWNSDIIRMTLKEHTWKNIVEKYLYPVLMNT
jgi:glycosyltransferase involved in cell wall biosynthesis